jgi:SEC-C motif-containing protein
MMKPTLCPCGLEAPYENCCGRYIEQGFNAPTPELLMRSRYSAFATQNIPYIVKTMHGKASQGFNPAELSAWLATVHWLNLRVCQSKQTGDQGKVSFIATYESQGKKYQLSEISAFAKIENEWFYIDGQTPLRNQPCLCGSAKKFKHCCGREDSLK